MSEVRQWHQDWSTFIESLRHFEPFERSLDTYDQRAYATLLADRLTYMYPAPDHITTDLLCRYLHLEIMYDINLAFTGRLDHVSKRYSKLSAIEHMIAKTTGNDAVAAHVRAFLDAKNLVINHLANEIEYTVLRAGLFSLAETDKLVLLNESLGSTKLSLYTGRDGYGRFDHLQITLRPTGRRNHYSVVLSGTLDNLHLSACNIMAPFPRAVAMMTDVIDNWPTYRANCLQAQ